MPRYPKGPPEKRIHKVDTDYVRRQLATGRPIEELAHELQRSVGGIKQALKHSHRDADTLIEPEPADALRARWERLLPRLKANLIREMIRDDAA